MALTSSDTKPQPLGRVVAAVKDWVGRLGSIWVDAQVIEVRRRAGAATHFLTLRDRYAEVSANATASTFVLDGAGPLQPGAQVVALIQPRVWEKHGSLTFECLELRVAGVGALLAQIERRKHLLEAEGLFDPRRRKPLAFLPRVVGLISAKNSDAERDVRVNLARRWPGIEVRFVPAVMQGPKCAETVIAALAELQDDHGVDVIVIARGGGSLEDLLGFSDEGVVRAVAECIIPVVSAIGHEADTPLIDFAADLRASTPTDAAKRIVPDASEEAALIDLARQRIGRAITGVIQTRCSDLAELRLRPVLKDPTAAFAVQSERVGAFQHRLRIAIERRLEVEAAALVQARRQIRALSPQATLERGYAILTDQSQAGVEAGKVSPGERVHAYVADGQIDLEVLEANVR